MADGVAALENCEDCEHALDNAIELQEYFKLKRDLWKDQHNDKDRLYKDCARRKKELSDEAEILYKELRRLTRVVNFLTILCALEGGVIVVLLILLL